jgi:hypothetical protein
LLSSAANVLARESSCDDINGNSVSLQSFGGEFSHVMITGHLRPMLRQYTAGKFFDFAKGDSFKAARSLKAKAETANAAEQI